MKIELDPKKSMGQSTLRLSHGNEESFWDVSAYYQRSGERTPSLEDNVIFDEINAYWAQLSPERQAGLWACYQRAREILDTHYDINALRRPLMGVAKQLYDLMPMPEIAYWEKFQNIRKPNTLKDQYEPRDIPEQTYLRQDYNGLVVLAIALRPMLPIWGEFIGSTAKEAGNAFKEYQALSLVKNSTLMQSEPMQRLIVYISAFVERSQQPALSSSALLSGLGSSELLNWVLGLTVVRRLTVGQISAKDDNSSLISNVHQYIQNNLKSLDRKVGVQKFGGTGRVVDKKKPDQNVEDQKASVVELYKVKQEVPDGDLVILNVYSEDVTAMMDVVMSDWDPAKLNACLESIKSLENLPIEPHQITLAQWVVNRCIPARGIPQLSKPSLLRVLAVTQTALWHWGFFDLAALATASPLTVPDDEMHAGLEGRARISKELMEELVLRWPHYRVGRGKQVTMRQQNVASRAVDKFCGMIAPNDWQLHAPTELLQLTSRFPNTKRLTVPQDIRADVARLILKIAV